MTTYGIPTVYNGIQFRSRIEAKWAAMFDLLKWPWEYEPIDLNGYIPDFVLSFQKPMIVEVKSYLDSPFDWMKCDHEAGSALTKIARSGWRGEGLLVGGAMTPDRRAMGHCGVQGPDPINPGLLFNCHEDSAKTGELYAEPFGFKACCGGPVDVVGVFFCRQCGDHDEGPTLMDSTRIVSLWRQATNVVQWKSPSKARRRTFPMHVAPEVRQPTADDTDKRLTALSEDEFAAWLASVATRTEALTDRELEWWLIHGRSASAESPSGFCYSCGCPIGHDRRGVPYRDSEWVHASSDAECAAEIRRVRADVSAFFSNFSFEDDKR